ncbi:APC family permease [Mycolicibacterium sp.]|uniref:APC family permease n=1 Tax=Mycolicibacterium sp. TaxID=2320850 RepID=UPI003D0F6D18
MDSLPRTGAPAATSGPHELTGNLGPRAIIFMVIAAAAPLTVVGGVVPIGIAYGNGIGFPLTFIGAAVILLLFSVGLVALSKHIPATGSFFTYITSGLGQRWGTPAAYLAVLTYTSVQVAVLSYFGETLSVDLGLLGLPRVDWTIPALVCLGLVGVLGYRHIEFSSKVLIVALIAEAGIVLALVLAITVTGGAEGLTAAPFAPGNIISGAPALGLMFALASYIGFESTVVYRSEAADPQRTIPRATYGSVVLVAVFYALAAWGVVVGYGASSVVQIATEQPTTFLAQLADDYLGRTGLLVVDILLPASMFACVLSLHNVLTRYQHTMAGTSLLPVPLSRVHTKHGSPHLSSVVQVATAAVVLIVIRLAGLSGVQAFAWGAGLGTLAIAALMALTCLSVIAYFRKNRNDVGPWRSLIAPGLGALGLVSATAFIAWNFPLLVGEVDDAGVPTWGPVSFTLIGLIAASLIVGLAQSFRARARVE